MYPGPHGAAGKCWTSTGFHPACCIRASCSSLSSPHFVFLYNGVAKKPESYLGGEWSSPSGPIMDGMTQWGESRVGAVGAWTPVQWAG